MKKRLLSTVLAICMVMSLSSGTVFADNDAIASGECGAQGNNLAWALDSEGVLTISGLGEMANYGEMTNTAPWYTIRENIKKVVIEDGVTNIGKFAFYYCSSLSRVTLPNSVSIIDEDAFRSCGALTEIILPDNLAQIMGWAFCGCSSLPQITIPDSVSTIGHYAFSDCTSLTQIAIPRNVSSMGILVFNGCKSLTEINISAGNQKYCSEDGILFSADKRTLICYPAAKEGAYSIPDSVTNIAQSAFCDCSGLTGINIPEGINAINANTFSGCTGLTEITIPDGVTSIGGWAFGSCENLTKITLPNSLVSIGQSVFSHCHSLTEISIPDGVTNIAEDAFGDCRSLTEITLPANAQFIGYGTWWSMFRDCSSLAAIYVSDGSPYYYSEDGVLFSADKTKLIRCPAAKSGTYAIPYGVTSIEDYAFRDCNSLTEITISDTVAKIGEGAFEGCGSLTGNITTPKGVTSIGDRVFYACKSLTGITLSDSIDSIGREAFMYCESLTEIKVPDNVTSIGSYAFYYCIHMTKATLPDGLTSIGSDVFQQCYALKEVNIPKSLNKIPVDTFNSCRSLSGSIIIPDGVTSIAGGAFSECWNITDVTIPGSVESIGSQAFWYCNSMTELTIQDGVKSIGYNAFGWCTRLTTSYIPRSVTEIGSIPFGQCTSLKDIYFGGTEEEWNALNVTLPDNGDGYPIVHFSAVVTYNANGGTGTMEDALVYTSEVYTLPDCGFNAPTGKEFKAWQINGKEYAPGSTYTITSNTTVTAIWKDIDTPITPPDVSDKYTVSYDANGGTGTMAGTLVGASEMYTLPACGFTAPTGKEFKAWQINGEEYAPGSTYTITSNTTVTTVWQETSTPTEPPEVFDKYTVFYDANGGTGTMDDTQANAGKAFVLPVCGFTAPTGKEFKAWQINGEEYAPGSTYTITSNTTVTAVWQDASTTPTQPVNPSEPVTEYTLTGTITGHKGVTYTSVTAQLVGSDGSAYPAEVGTGIVDKTGKTEYAYTVSAPAGQYNLNVKATTAAGIVVNRTAFVNLTGDGQTQNINLPNGQASSSGSSSGNSSNSDYKISIPTNINGGTVTVSPTSARAGATVTITASPDKGYELESIVVKDSKGNSIAVTEVGNAKYTFTMPSSSVSVSAAFVAVTPTPVTTFIDVEPGAYYADAVAWAVENGITSGTGDGKFSPHEPCTRGQIVTFLWRAAGCPEVDITTAFADVAPGSYYEIAVAWAVANGITNGAGDGKFSPNEPCTRAQAVAFFYRAKGSPSTDENGFSDVGSGLWYTDAVSWAVANGITNGTGNGRFSPDDICTRGQIVTFLYRDMA